MLDDMCLLIICQIKIHQPQKISNLPNFDPSKLYLLYGIPVLSEPLELVSSQFFNTWVEDVQQQG